MRRIALIAHDACKDDMCTWVGAHIEILSGFSFVATGSTGSRIIDAFPALAVQRVKSGPLGGDQQIGSMIAEGKIIAMIFLIDPLSAMPHDVDVKALTRLAVLYDLPFACNKVTAEAVMEHIIKHYS